MADSPTSPADRDATVPDVMAAFQMLRAAQDAEARAMEAMLLSQIDDQKSGLDTAKQSLERAIAQHRAAAEELTALREFGSKSNRDRR